MACADDKKRRVVLVRSRESIIAADRLPSNLGRASRVHGLIDAFGLDKMVQIVSPRAASDAELAAFHSDEYIRAVCYGDVAGDAEGDSGSEGSGDDDDDEDFGLSYDCAVFDGMAKHVRYAGGGTLCGARMLVSGAAHVAVHWEGGRHHGRRARAAGFCYVNDVVLGILALQRRFGRVLYVDVDVHHGDGVQEAFEHSAQVTTLSVHHAGRGFYPPSGGTCIEGKGRGLGHSANVALGRGASDATFERAFAGAAEAVARRERRLGGDDVAVVVQCGSDGLGGDPVGAFNLTGDAYVACVRRVVAWGWPVLVLGGGGYARSDCARCWARVTAAVCGVEIAADADVPEHEFLAEYALGFYMATAASAAADENTVQAVQALVETVEAAMEAA
ncbi:hypothetical protein IW150_001249 [Coemansia sp. RSA 2607]|nr:hypothetical protein IW150_001249 [Coemansia sp. RSA 2607]